MKGKKIISLNRYNEFNWTVIGLAILVAFLPIFMFLLGKIAPWYIKCIYLELTGNPCPFCGVTRDIKNIITGDIFAFKYNWISVPTFILCIIEFMGRVCIICNKKTLEDIDYRNKIVKYDIRYHALILIGVILYILGFFIFDLARF